jgi:putative membrane protein
MEIESVGQVIFLANILSALVANKKYSYNSKIPSMKKYYLAYALLALFACDDDDNKGSLNNTDKPFVQDAALANKAEIQFGELAASKGADPMVVGYGQHMKDEHQPALDDLKDIADDYDNVTWPGDMDTMHQQLYEQLQTLNGAAFDSAYIKSQIDDHNKAITLFQHEGVNGVEQRVKAYANKYLPHLREHLDRADSIQTVMKIKRIGG